MYQLNSKYYLSDEAAEFLNRDPVEMLNTLAGWMSEMPGGLAKTALEGLSWVVSTHLAMSCPEIEVVGRNTRIGDDGTEAILGLLDATPPGQRRDALLWITLLSTVSFAMTEDTEE